MKNYALTTLKGLNTYWLKESAKLIYNSYGLDFDGKTIEIKLTQQGYFTSACYTTAKKIDNLPQDTAVIGFAIAKLDENNPNGLITFENRNTSFYDRIVVHEMVHAAMFIDGALKPLGMPQFFFEGIADLIQGDDDATAGHTETIKNFFEKPETLSNALSDIPYYTDTAADYPHYPAGHMFLRYLAKQALDTNIYVLMEENQNDPIIFDGNNRTIITNYDSSKVINYRTDFISANLYRKAA